jgi:hypothetical protein
VVNRIEFTTSLQPFSPRVANESHHRFHEITTLSDSGFVPIADSGDNRCATPGGFRFALPTLLSSGPIVGCNEQSELHL